MTNHAARIAKLKPASIFHFVPHECFHEITNPSHAAYIKSGNYYEWKYAIASYAAISSVIEIGVRFGYSLCAFLAGATGRPPLQAHGIDNGSYEPGWKPIAHAAVLNLADYTGRGVKLTLQETDSEKLAALPSGFDLVHIDGPHYYRETYRLLELAKAADCRVIVVDDLTSCPDDCKAVRDFTVAHKLTYTHIDSHRGDAVIFLRT